MMTGFKVLARLKVLRGTPFDPFGYSAERRAERALITQYEADMRDAPGNLALLALPDTIRGFGPVKAAAMAQAAEKRADLRRQHV